MVTIVPSAMPERLKVSLNTRDVFPVALVPVVGAEVAVGPGWVRAIGLEILGVAPPENAPTPVVAFLLVACAAVALAAVHLMVRTLRLSPVPVT